MKLLIITQRVDKRDPVLGFFHRWIEEFAKKCEKVTVICLGKGKYDLPPNVEVLSLGKEEGNFQFSIFNFQKFGYILRFYKYVLQADYDKVFVHMNQEYVLLAGDLWRLMGKKIYLWRNHSHGNWLTNISVMFAHKVFCTSPSSYTAKFDKTKLMPVGIDTDFFKPDPSLRREGGSILFLGRIAPIKKVAEFMEWLDGRDFKSATIAGEALPKDKGYEEKVRVQAREKFADKVKFVGPVTQEGALKLYQTHELYVNLTQAGSFDKTILEAAACECRVFVENSDLQDLNKMSGQELRSYVIENHSLKLLMSKLDQEMR